MCTSIRLTASYSIFLHYQRKQNIEQFKTFSLHCNEKIVSLICDSSVPDDLLNSRWNKCRFVLDSSSTAGYHALCSKFWCVNSLRSLALLFRTANQASYSAMYSRFLLRNITDSAILVYRRVGVCLYAGVIWTDYHSNGEISNICKLLSRCRFVFIGSSIW